MSKNVTKLPQWVLESKPRCEKCGVQRFVDRIDGVCVTRLEFGHPAEYTIENWSVCRYHASVMSGVAVTSLPT